MNAIQRLEKPDHVPADRVVDFDIYAPPNVGGDIYDSWRVLQQPGTPEVVWTAHNEGHWIPTRSAVILEVMKDFERFSNSNVIIPKSHGNDYKVIPGSFDPPQHAPYRKSLNNVLSLQTVRGVEDKIRALASTLIDGLKPNGACSFTTEYAEILPITMFFALMDLPVSDIPTTKYWANQMFRPDGSITFADALAKLMTYLDPFVKNRTGKEGTDMLSRLVNTKIDGAALSHSEALQLATQAMIAGLDTVVSFLGFVFLHLANDAPLRHELASDPKLIAKAVDEFLRRFPIVTIGREVRVDTEFHGVQLKAGDMMAIPTLLAATDELFNEEPTNFDVHRSRRNILTFGNGHHHCPGRYLARAEISISIEEWLKRIPDFSVDLGAKVTCTAGVVTTVNNLRLAWPTSSVP
jgi:cytochrome P450